MKFLTKNRDCETVQYPPSNGIIFLNNSLIMTCEFCLTFFTNNVDRILPRRSKLSPVVRYICNAEQRKENNDWHGLDPRRQQNKKRNIKGAEKKKKKDERQKMRTHTSYCTCCRCCYVLNINMPHHQPVLTRLNRYFLHSCAIAVVYFYKWRYLCLTRVVL